MLNSKQPPWPRPAKRWYQQSVALTQVVTRYRRKVCDIVYGNDDVQKLDIYLPDEFLQVQLPVVIFVHGGYFTNGDRHIAGHMSAVINQLPAIFVNVGYRLAPSASLEQQIDDIAHATAWVNRHIHQYGGDNQRIVLSGHSAGGHLASMIALQRERLEAYGMPISSLRACMPISGVYDLLNTVPRVSRYVIRCAGDPFVYSPVFQAHADTPKLILSVAQNDFDEMRQVHDVFYRRLTLCGAPVSELVLPQCNHFSETFFNTIDDAWIQTLSSCL